MSSRLALSIIPRGLRALPAAAKCLFVELAATTVSLAGAGASGLVAPTPSRNILVA